MSNPIAKRMALTAVLLSIILGPAHSRVSRAVSFTGSTAKNSWRGLVPLRSSPADVARVLGVEIEAPDASVSGPFRVEGGEVTFYYLTPSLAKAYRAPRAIVGKVFTIYFKPDEALTRQGLKLPAGFKRCVEQDVRSHYYLVNDGGVAYQLRREGDQVETVIYQPSRDEVRRLSVNTECVF